MRKVFIATIIILTTLYFTPAESAEISVVTPYIIKCGNTFVLYIAANDLQNFYSADFIIKYNASAMDVLEISNGSIGSVEIITNYSIENGICKIVAISSNGGIDGDGYLAALHIFPKKEGVFNIAIQGNISNYNAEKIDAMWKNATVIFTFSEIKIDVKGDGKIMAYVNLTNATEFYSTNFTLLYDYTFLTPEKIDSPITLSYSMEAGKIKFAGYMDEAENVTEINLARINFHPLKTGITSLNLTEITASNGKAERIYCVAVNKSFLIAGNIPPIANFTWQPEQPTDLDFITFNASSSYDEDGFIANYTWNFGDGSIAYGSVVEHKYEYDGKYIVNLTVVDNDGAISWREKEIEVANIPPIANFTWQPPYPTTTDTIHFYSSSYDLDGSVANYTWNFGDGNIGYGKNVTHKYSNEGNYTVNLTIKDDNGDVAWIAKEIKVSVENHPPYATNPQPANNSFGISKYTDLSIIANDADGDILTVTFYDASDNLIGSVENILSGSTASVIWHDLEYSKTYYWYVIISDGKESVKSPIWHFTTKENEPPTKPTLAAPSSSYTNTPVTFSAVSMDDDRIRYGFDWDNDDAVDEWTNWYNSGVKVFASHLWDSEGIYYVKVIAEDEYGMKSEWSNIHQITIMQYIPPLPTNHPPSIEITSPANGSVVSGIITIQGMASDKDGNESIVKVEIRIDGKQWKEAEGTTSWSYSWDTTEVSNGWHKIEARCYDGIDYSNIVSIKINVQNEEEKGINVMLFAAIFIIALFIAVAIYLRKKM